LQPFELQKLFYGNNMSNVTSDSTKNTHGQPTIGRLHIDGEQVPNYSRDNRDNIAPAAHIQQPVTNKRSYILYEKGETSDTSRLFDAEDPPSQESSQVPLVVSDPYNKSTHAHSRSPSTSHKNASTSLFAANNFDPGSFYGEEEEDEDKQEEQNTANDETVDIFQQNSQSVPEKYVHGHQYDPTKPYESSNLLELFGLAPEKLSTEYSSSGKHATGEENGTDPFNLGDIGEDYNDFNLPASNDDSSSSDNFSCGP